MQQIAITKRRLREKSSTQIGQNMERQVMAIDKNAYVVHTEEIKNIYVYKVMINEASYKLSNRKKCLG